MITSNKITKYTTIYNTRNSTKLHVSYKRTNYRTYTVFNKGISLWNFLDDEIKNTKTYFSFKRKTKSLYLLSIINVNKL
jgi:hypothetical protein